MIVYWVDLRQVMYHRLPDICLPVVYKNIDSAAYLT